MTIWDTADGNYSTLYVPGPEWEMAVAKQYLLASSLPAFITIKIVFLTTDHKEISPDMSLYLILFVMLCVS